MIQNPPGSKQRSSSGGALRITLLYLLVGILWITLSDSMTAALLQTSAVFTQLSIVKGWAFIGLTAVLLYWLIRQHTGALRDSEARYRLLAENVSDVIWVLDLESNRFQYVSPSIQRLRGLTVEEALAETMSDALTPESAAYLAAQLPDRLAKFQQGAAGVYTDEVQQLRKDGTPVWVEVVSRFVVNGQNGRLEVYGTSRDIMERKQAEKELARKEQLLRLTGEMAHVGGWEFDVVTLQGTWTDEVARIHDLDPRQETDVALGLSFYNPETRQRLEQAIQQAIEAREPYDMELQLTSAKGVSKWVRTMGLPVMQGEQVIKVRGIFQDISQRKQAEEEIRQLNTQLEQRVAERTAQLRAANEELEAFSYSVSHDLRAPLRTIDGFTRILVEDYEAHLGEEGQHLCHVIRQQTRRLGQLIDDLLNFSRLNRAALRPVEVDAAQLVAQCYAELVSPEERQRIEFRLSDLPPALADPTLLRQVWLNLLGNAIKFSAHCTEPVIEVGGRVTEEETLYWIQDNGAGFDMKYAARLFGVFQRLHNDQEYPGTGVGLAIVQRIINRHGGRVWGEGVVNEGATFTFTLPRREA